MSHNSPVQGRLKFQLDRIALFSDAVFAIAITLLVIELKLPPVSIEENDFGERFWHTMAEMTPEFIGFLISFIVIGSYWRAHHAIFGFVTDYDRKLLSLNSWFLFTITLMPFSTAIMSKYIYFQPYLLYSINVMASGLLQVWLWRYILSKKNKLSEEVPRGVAAYKTFAPLVVVGCFLVSLLVHFLFGSFVARLFLISIFIIQRIVTRYYQKNYQVGKRF